ncbi:hypothetical protein ACKVWC_002688 [Pyricularia oryzae]
MASQQQNERSNNDRLALAQLPLDTVMSGYTHYELNENLEIEKWHRPAALAAPAPGTLLPPSPEENIERSLELRARWEEQPEVPTDKVPDDLAEAERKSIQVLVMRIDKRLVNLSALADEKYIYRICPT